MKQGPQGYIRGGAYALCDRCGFKVRHSSLRKEWSGLMTCPPCWDPRPEEHFPPTIGPEGLPVDNPRPEPADQFIDPENPVTADDL